MDRKFKIGDTVKVKNGTTDSEFGIDIGGCHGQILEIVNDQVVINWDSITLSNIPDEYIFQCEQEGLDWGAIFLAIDQVQIAMRRDTHKKI